MPFIEVNKLTKVYAGEEKPVLQSLDFSCERGELVGIFGASGTGKSTFLHSIGGLDRPTKGSIVVNGQEIYKLKENQISDFRNRTIGFVFQFFHLLNELSSLENVMLPCIISGMAGKEAQIKAAEALASVGLLNKDRQRPATLSGGERQRIAIARAVVMHPPVLLADEPTGNLDQATGQAVLDFLLKLHYEHGIGVIMVTHNPRLLERMPKKLEMKEGRLWGD